MSYDKPYDEVTQMLATAPPQDQTYRLKKIEEIETFLRDQVARRDALTK